MNDSIKYERRRQLLITELTAQGIKDPNVLLAIEKVPRQHFITHKLAEHAYENKALPIEKGQTISQPYTVAFQTELLQVQKGDKILEIGTGSGYQAAVLCELGAEVYSIERIYDLHEQARKRLSDLGYSPVLVYADGLEGLPDNAPFDKILITAAMSELPNKLLKQLKIGGRLVAPIGDSNLQKMIVIERVDVDEFKKTEHGTFVFVPIRKGTE